MVTISTTRLNITKHCILLTAGNENLMPKPKQTLALKVEEGWYGRAM
jgi:hypothetical protein